METNDMVRKSVKLLELIRKNTPDTTRQALAVAFAQGAAAMECVYKNGIPESKEKKTA